MEEKKYIFVCFTDNVVDSWSQLTPIFARAHNPDGGRTEPQSNGHRMDQDVRKSLSVWDLSTIRLFSKRICAHPTL